MTSSCEMLTIKNKGMYCCSIDEPSEFLNIEMSLRCLMFSSSKPIGEEHATNTWPDYHCCTVWLKFISINYKLRYWFSMPSINQWCNTRQKYMLLFSLFYCLLFTGFRWPPGDRLNIKMSSYEYRGPHVKHKMASRPYINNGIPIPGKDRLYIETGSWSM